MRLSNKSQVEPTKSGNRSMHGQDGASVIELLIVIVVILIIAAFSLFSLTGHKAAYKTDDQTIQIIDVMRAAALRAVTQRQTIRVEINLTTNNIVMIDENSPGISSDDVIVRTKSMEKVTDVKLSTAPLNATALPPTPSNFPAAVFASSVHPSSNSNNVCTIRFRRDGTVVNAGANALGSGAAITSTTLYVWPPKPTDNARATTTGSVRAITIFGPTGNIRLWKYVGTAFVLG